ncbi:MAG TPA: energy transducer TonB, partial [Usitatibacter sp.]|nr:energy transducer TonB [Usitatibacter sp.]
TVAAVLALAALAGAAAAWWWLRTPSRYFTAAEVEHVAAPVRRLELQFPEGREGIDYYGTLRMDVLIDEKGHVDRVDVIQSTVPQAFRDHAVQIFSTAVFEPAQRGGRAVKSVKKVEVQFAPPIRGLRP